MWHTRLGHPCQRVLNHVVRDFLPARDLNKVSFCKHCVQGKMTELPFPLSVSNTSSPLELVHSDVWGPAPITSINGTRYFVIFVDDFTRFTWFFPLSHKSQVLSSFIHFKNTMENLLNAKVKTLRTDCGSEYTKHEFTNFCSQSGIFYQFTCPHTSQQNGVAERKHRHIVDISLTLISHSSLPLTYWSYAFATAVHLINRIPSSHRAFISPWEALFHSSPDYSIFKSFRCACFPLLRPYSKHKLLPRSRECVFLGYASNSKGYLCLDIASSRLFVSRHVIFNESHFPFHHVSSISSLSSPHPNPWLSNFLFFTPCHHPSILGPHINPSTSILGPHINPTTSTLGPHTNTSASLLGPHPSTVPSPYSDSVLGPHPTTLPNPPTSIPEPVPLAPSRISSPILEPTSIIQPIPLPLPNFSPPVAPIPPSPPPFLVDPSIPTNTHPMTTRSKSGISCKKVFAASSVDYLQTEPPTCTIASRIPEWCATMAAEFEALHRQSTWSLVPASPRQNLIGCRWVFKLKRNSNGSIARYKARLVAKGFHQQPGIDYAETFSPVVKPPTVRIILSLAAHHHWNLRQLDVSNAFLHGVLKEEVFMQQPPGFVDSELPHHVCKLHKSLYGLKQAPRAWFERFTSHLLTLCFVASIADPSLFIFRHNGIVLYLLLYVDDIILTGNDSAAISTLITQLASNFELKDLGPLRYFLGLQIEYTTSGLFVHQRKYLTDLLSRFHMMDCKAASTPFVSQHKPSGSSATSLHDPTHFRSMVGALQYATFTRPDIQFAVNQVCQFMHSPSSNHLVAAKHILRYLKGSLDLGIFFQLGPLHLTAFTDADRAGDPHDRRSTSGLTVFLGNNPITWLSKKQHTVSRSSTEAEYRSLATGAAELAWLRQVLRDMGLFLPSAPVIWCDNTSALALASNPVFHGRTKHIEVDFHFVRERVVRGDIRLHFISTDDQVADLFTKAFSSPRFSKLRSKLLISSSDHQFAGG